MTKNLRLKEVDDIHETLSPVYETVRILARELPKETTLIDLQVRLDSHLYGCRTGMRSRPAHALKGENRDLFDKVIDRLTLSTVAYLAHQIEAGVEVVKLFDSWAGSLEGDFDDFALNLPNR